MPLISTTPMGLVDTAVFVRQLGQIVRKGIYTERSSGSPPKEGLRRESKRSSLVDAANLNEKQVSNLEDPFEYYIDQQTRFVSQAAWFSRSIDCQNLAAARVWGR